MRVIPRGVSTTCPPLGSHIPGIINPGINHTSGIINIRRLIQPSSYSLGRRLLLTVVRHSCSPLCDTLAHRCAHLSPPAHSGAHLSPPAHRCAHSSHCCSPLCTFLTLVLTVVHTLPLLLLTGVHTLPLLLLPLHTRRYNTHGGITHTEV